MTHKFFGVRRYGAPREFHLKSIETRSRDVLVHLFSS